MEARWRLSPSLMAASELPIDIFVMNVDGTGQAQSHRLTDPFPEAGTLGSYVGRRTDAWIAFRSRRLFRDEAIRSDIFRDYR